MSKSNKKNTNSVARPFQVMCTDIYLLWILIVFPLYYADGYFHLPENKSIFWCTSTLIYLGVILFGVVITAISMREYWSFENFKKNISGTDICMFGFLISNLIAFALSDDKANSWTGANGRYYGAKVLLLVCVVYFVVSRYAWLNKVFIWAFLIGGNGVCLLATFDYFGMDVLGINKQMQYGLDWIIFISTMGNANTCASYVTMALAGAIVYYCVEKNVKLKIFAAISVINCSAALITSRSDSAYVGVGTILLILGILALIKKIEWKEYIVVLGLIDIGMLILFMFRNANVDKLIWGETETGVSMFLNQPWTLVMVLLALCVIFAVATILEGKIAGMTNKQKKILTILVGIIMVVCIVVGAIKFDVINMLKQGLGIDAEFTIGTRWYTYEKVLQAYRQVPLVNKVFGCGQASMTSLLYQYFGEEFSSLGIRINSAHNHILDYLIITGIVGVICYLGAVMFAIKNAFTTFKENKNTFVVAFVAVAYFAQGIFNIEQATTTTTFWLMIACCEALYRENVLKKSI